MKKKIAFLLISILCLSCLHGIGVYADNMEMVRVYYIEKGTGKLLEHSIVVPNQFKNEKEIFAVTKLLDKTHIPNNAFSEIPDGVRLNSMSINNGIAYVDLSKEFIEKIDQNTSIDFVLDSLLNTIFQFDNINSVIFTVEGKKLNIINGYDFSLPFNKTFKTQETDLSINQEAGTNSLDPPNPVVVIDPGHGGSDTGAISNGVYEKDINLEIAKILRDYLINKGATVYMTRETDIDVKLSDRYGLANSVEADFFVSVHINSCSDPSIKGTTCIYPNNHDISVSQNLAYDVHDQCIEIFYNYREPYKDERNLAVLRNTTMPAIITETGFLSNSEDREFLITSNGQSQTAYRIYLGIRKFWWGY